MQPCSSCHEQKALSMRAEINRGLLSLSVASESTLNIVFCHLQVAKQVCGGQNVSYADTRGGGRAKTYPETASGSAMVLRLISMKAWGTGAPACGLFPLAMISAALMLALLVLLRLNSRVTADGRLNCEYSVQVR